VSHRPWFEGQQLAQGGFTLLGLPQFQPDRTQGEQGLGVVWLVFDHHIELLGCIVQALPCRELACIGQPDDVTGCGLELL